MVWNMRFYVGRPLQEPAPPKPPALGTLKDAIEEEEIREGFTDDKDKGGADMN